MDHTETAENAAVESEAQTSANVDEGWDDGITTATEADEGGNTAEASTDVEQSAEAENPSREQSADAEKPAEGPGESGSETETPAAPATVHVKYMDTEKDLSIEEAAELAQKGMDYDRVRAKYDESKPAMELIGYLAKQSGMNAADFITYVRTEAKKSQGMTDEQAKQAVALEDREASVSEKETEQKEQASRKEADAAAKKRQQEEFARFAAKYPDVKPETIPKSVWEAVGGGESPVEAYQDYLIAKSAADALAAKQAAQNAAASSGSMTTAGSGDQKKDLFDEGWDE